MPSDITTVLDEQNIEAAPGQLGEQGNQSFQYVLTYKGRLESEEEFGNIVISATEDGEVLHLKDVATIELGRLSYSMTTNVNGHAGTTYMVFQTAGSNAMDINNSIESFLEEAEADFPDGVKSSIQLNTNDFLYASIWEVVKTLFEAFLLVILVTYIFLQNTRTTLIPTIAIPVALIGSFFLMWVFGFSINLLTLCAMVLAIGTVVDDAIIVVEAVQAKLDAGYTSAKQASLDAMSEISSAIISSTLVMMAIFIPVSFTGGTTGIFFKQQGLTMAFAIGISGINALTLSPALCALMLKPVSKDGKKKASFAQRFHSAFNANFKRLTNKYKKGVSFFTGHKLMSGSLVGIVIISFVVLLRVTPTGFIPNEDQGIVFGALSMPVGRLLEETTKEMDKISELVQSIPAVESYSINNGYSLIDGSGNTYGMLICRLKDWDLRGDGESVDEIIAQLYKETAKVVKNGNMIYLAPPMVPGYSVTNGFELKLQDKTGGDLSKFETVAKDFIQSLTSNLR